MKQSNDLISDYKKHSLNKKLMGGTSDKQRQDLLIESAKTVSKLSDELDRKSKYSDLAEDYKFMDELLCR